MFAFSLVSTDGQPLHDPKYVRLLAVYQELYEDGSSIAIEIPLRDCTEEDFAKFYPIEEES